MWLDLTQIIWIDILLSGDNALVIAMACRGLGAKKMWGMIFGAGAAILVRVLCTGVISSLMTLPYVKVVGGIALMWIAFKLLVSADSEGSVDAPPTLWDAVKIVVIADIVMSIDNMVAVAAVAKGDWFLLAVGLLVSIPCIIAGASVIVAALNRLPILVWAGAALLGWIAGGLIASEPHVKDVLNHPLDPYLLAFAATATVVLSAALIRGVRHA